MTNIIATNFVCEQLNRLRAENQANQLLTRKSSVNVNQSAPNDQKTSHDVSQLIVEYTFRST